MPDVASRGSRIRRLCSISACILLLGGMFSPARSQDDYPSKFITAVVPYTPGGTVDTIARYLGRGITDRLAQSVVVENKPGGGTNIGANFVAKAEPDGYTFFVGTSTPLAINATLYEKLQFNPKEDFSLVSLVAESPLVLVVDPNLPIKSYADLVKFIREQKKPITYASSGIGSPHHLLMELLKSKTGLEMTHVAYRGTSLAVTDVVAGRIPMMFCDILSCLELVNAGKVRAIFVGPPSRLEVLPDVPSSAEVGLDNFVGASWVGIAVPAKVPLERQQKLRDVLVDVIDSDEFKKMASKVGLQVMKSGSLTELKAFADGEIERWGEIVKTAGATMK